MTFEAQKKQKKTPEGLLTSQSLVTAITFTRIILSGHFRMEFLTGVQTCDRSDEPLEPIKKTPSASRIKICSRTTNTVQE